MRLQIDEQLRNVGQMENGQKSAEWEAQVFNRSRTREEYVKLVATLIWKLRDYNKKVYFNFDLGHIMKTQISGPTKPHRYDIEQASKDGCKRGCVFPIVVWPACRMEQYRVNDNPYRAPQFIARVTAAENQKVGFRVQTEKVFNYANRKIEYFRNDSDQRQVFTKYFPSVC